MNRIALGIWSEFAGQFPEAATKIQYRKTKGMWPDFKYPVLFDEKLSYLKLYKYANDPLVIQCADKYRVREYVEKHNCSEILNRFYGVWEHVEDIPFDSLPDSFVLKCTHGCHMNIVCPDKKELNISKARKDLNSWMREKQWKVQQELHYKAIKPRIICEKYLKPVGGGTLPPDFKIYCFNGEPKLVLVITDREHEMELTFRDLKWNLLDIGNRKTNESIACPSCFDDMLEYSRKLSKGFPFVRMDFYDFDGKPIFGEMTFTPAGCNADYYTSSGQKMLGEMLNI